MKKFWLFSEAMREGSKLRPQARCLLFVQGRSCAVGAGLEAIGFEYRELTETQDNLKAYGIAEQAFPYLEVKTECPADNCRLICTLLNVAWHLNDHHFWTREQIADWLEREEEKLGLITTVIVESEQERSSSQVVAVGV